MVHATLLSCRTTHKGDGACADLDHTNEDLRSHIKEWLNWLKDDIGFEGWRFDFVKGYGPQFIKEYVMETVGAQSYNVGEFWVDCRCAPPFKGLLTMHDHASNTVAVNILPNKRLIQTSIRNCNALSCGLAHTHWLERRPCPGTPMSSFR